MRNFERIRMKDDSKLSLYKRVVEKEKQGYECIRPIQKEINHYDARYRHSDPNSNTQTRYVVYMRKHA
ncbi:hypothetical protein SAMN05192534_12348 [Alteribacillus persepolensis]|uniref:Uncharacterized protein n=1 Tax=Alteribacillus persepolensis TaxID=568899 RepID=A0A1G8I8W8_9BACI|nr:hypothetical protein [Alteribacillus persepolensis]SDI15425.1 hypothetical protein SAMN05192534_12348 [Alteribacillus persepolensis]